MAGRTTAIDMRSRKVSAEIKATTNKTRGRFFKRGHSLLGHGKNGHFQPAQRNLIGVGNSFSKGCAAQVRSEIADAATLGPGNDRGVRDIAFIDDEDFVFAVGISERLDVNRKRVAPDADARI